MNWKETGSPSIFFPIYRSNSAESLGPPADSERGIVMIQISGSNFFSCEATAEVQNSSLMKICGLYEAIEWQ
jgi:hypothetical protein